MKLICSAVLYIHCRKGLKHPSVEHKCFAVCIGSEASLRNPCFRAFKQSTHYELLTQDAMTVVPRNEPISFQDTNSFGLDVFSFHLGLRCLFCT